MSTKSKGSPHLSVTVIKISLCYDIDPYFASQKKKKKKKTRISYKTSLLVILAIKTKV